MPVNTSDRRQGRNSMGGPGGSGAPGSGPDQSWRWVFALLILAVLAVVVIPPLLHHTPVENIPYSTFVKDVHAHEISSATVNNSTGVITGTLRNGKHYSVDGPSPVTSVEEQLLASVSARYVTPQESFLSQWLPVIIMVLVLVGIFYWFSRRAQGQMTGIMSIGRSRARLYTTERPRTTFADVAGYPGVKLEISEVVDFLKVPNRFRDIGARIPKGILLVGPPGTGKTLLARAVAGEAGVPFLSVSGSDFMEMFVGVGASRVRDLFQTARKQAPAIIFIDEIDSIGRKRGAGLGGGHDEREQTLNQMLSEMDGFDPAEGVVIMAATNRPDILDPALLRPGRFDRQIVVPLPDLEERLPILKVHCRDKRIGPDVDLELIARGTPGMSGADLANLVNEAALHAVRRGAHQVEMEDFEAARDRVLMGQRRESLVLTDEEKERVAYHEGGHAVLAYVLEHADPVHKVTILPTGMALGVTQQLPSEERHIYPREVIEDSLVVRMGGRAAELIVYGDLSTGASNDLVGNTELARKMVREWGMSEKLGPMAWGSQGMVFLGEDLLHSRDYSEDTARVVDDEVARILREQERRAIDLLTEHRAGLEAVARALLERETLSGEEVGRLVDEAYGRPVHQDRTARRKRVPAFVAGTNGAVGTEPALPAAAEATATPGLGAEHVPAPRPNPARAEDQASPRSDPEAPRGEDPAPPTAG
ncbi:ATP-dependent zinc metalloprotease FtsH [Aciditerrimonas ferrireducens]|jgi:cell division protease FtsH|uniref:ATP-dependent zinc metalloprotease FtsH n=1 Tax=Aciditerrimonas ferrireducens TaxID=667306 RepID=UPI002004DA20|nr:ATP-dependent zinc metalloprotease FtsH [Aciditerrimonas ferrireducens]MCK4177433.1 ATP-dependent zinc metalloprotease FtsH [Aciditerrimonas ferrireducens]